MTPPPRQARGQAHAYPRVTATPSVKVAAQDRRSTAVVLTAAIGTRPRFELQQAAKEQRSPGELGPARDSKRAAPPAPRRTGAAISDSDSSASSRAAGAPGRRAPAKPTSVAPTSGLSGLPGLGVFLGELGSPAKAGSGETSGRRSIAGAILGRGLRSVPSLVDVDVAIGGNPGRGRGFGRLAVPLRALVARRSSRPDAATAGVLGAATPVARPTAPLPKAAPAPHPSEPEPEAEAPSRAGPLRRASSYLVNGILDIAIRRFRADPRRH